MNELKKLERKRKKERKRKLKIQLKKRMLSFQDMYSGARQMKRHFILHVGDTNTGKTYHALQSLKEARKGIYLAPLRLLAYEIYEKLNEEGVLCDMITGEEKILIPNACFQSSTIEMLDTNTFYEKAVIDEGQMIEDRNRGWAWSAAIYGLMAKEIHICTAPYAVSLIENMIRSCEDTCEIRKYERMTELKEDGSPFRSLNDAKKHDALIVFSKKKVLYCAAELESMGIKCSVVYGSLPYDVRQAEMDRFISGETDVVVSTDAIGMGLNLPVERVVFLEDCKFDGIERRKLNSKEIRQIAGRAGRKGIYETGYWNAQEGKDRIRACMSNGIRESRYIPVGFPESSIEMNAPLSELLGIWDRITLEEPFKKTDIGEMLKKCRYLETLTDDKALIFALSSMPFSMDQTAVSQVWKRMAAEEIRGGQYIFDEERSLFSQVTDDLDTLEEYSAICDLFSFYDRKFHGGMESGTIMACRIKISQRIHEVLMDKSGYKKKCAYCGREISWAYPYKICQKCHEDSQRFRDKDFFIQ